MAHDARRLNALKGKLHSGAGTARPLGQLAYAGIADAMAGRPPVQQGPKDIDAGTAQAATVHPRLVGAALQTPSGFHDAAPVSIS
jgi:hypothetical protein